MATSPTNTFTASCDVSLQDYTSTRRIHEFVSTRTLTCANLLTLLIHCHDSHHLGIRPHSNAAHGHGMESFVQQPQPANIPKTHLGMRTGYEPNLPAEHNHTSNRTYRPEQAAKPMAYGSTPILKVPLSTRAEEERQLHHKQREVRHLLQRRGWRKQNRRVPGHS